MLEGRHAADGKAVVKAMRTFSRSQLLTTSERPCVCPVCDCHRVATGRHDVTWEADDGDKETGEVTNVYGEVWFNAEKFRCRVDDVCCREVGDHRRVASTGGFCDPCVG